MLARLAAVWITAFAGAGAVADDLLQSYDGDVPPYDPELGWLLVDNGCDSRCTEAFEDGHLILRWSDVYDPVGYFYRIATPETETPATLWAEWRFRSNHPFGQFSYSCDGAVILQYAGVFDLVFMYGDSAISFEGSDFIQGLGLDEFHTYRFESADGMNYHISVDGKVFIVDWKNSPNGSSSIQFRGTGGCYLDNIPDLVNAWDFVRFGTISYGERIIASDPPSGFVDAQSHPLLDRFTITYDSPNYVYLDEITVEVTPANQSRDREGAVLESDEGKEARSHEGTKGKSFDLRYSPFDIPVVVATRRLDNGPPDVVEIVLDRPIPYNATTRFTFTDGVAENVVEYTFTLGDADGDGRADLADFAYFQNCFGLGTALSDPAPCVAFDFDADSDIDLSDFAAFERVFAAP